MNESGLFERFISNAQSAATNLRIKSALNPMLWLCGIISLPCFVCSYLFRGTEPLASVLMYVGIAPVGATILGFFYFMIAAPDKLQSSARCLPLILIKKLENLTETYLSKDMPRNTLLPIL
jgi:hypothetical protein